MSRARPLIYLSRSDIARRLGLKSVQSLARTQLPEPDVMVGNHPGWREETVDYWQSNRPGRGWWGARTRIRK